jgi:hypothetical protein
MVRYPLTLADSKILELLKDSKNTLIAGCASCTNMATAHHRDAPIYDIVTDEGTGKKSLMPNAIMGEAERLKKLLEENKINAAIELNDGWCMWTTDKEVAALMGNPAWSDQGFKDRAISYDSVLVLACPDGVNGVKARIGGKTKVLAGMSSAGSLQLVMALDEKGEHVVIDKRKSHLIP